MEKEWNRPQNKEKAEILADSKLYCDKNGIIMYSPLVVYKQGVQEKNSDLLILLSNSKTDIPLQSFAQWKKKIFLSYTCYYCDSLIRKLEKPLGSDFANDMPILHNGSASLYDLVNPVQAAKIREDIILYLREFDTNNLILPDFSRLEKGLPNFKSKITGLINKFHPDNKPLSEALLSSLDPLSAYVSAPENKPLSEVLKSRFPSGLQNSISGELFKGDCEGIHLAMPFSYKWNLEDGSSFKPNELTYSGQIHFDSGSIYLSLAGIGLSSGKIVVSSDTLDKMDLNPKRIHLGYIPGEEKLHEIISLGLNDGLEVRGNQFYNPLIEDYMGKEGWDEMDIAPIKRLENLAIFIAAKRIRNPSEIKRY